MRNVIPVRMAKHPVIIPTTSHAVATFPVTTLPVATIPVPVRAAVASPIPSQPVTLKTIGPDKFIIIDSP